MSLESGLVEEQRVFQTNRSCTRSLCVAVITPVVFVVQTLLRIWKTFVVRIQPKTDQSTQTIEVSYERKTKIFTMEGTGGARNNRTPSAKKYCKKGPLNKRRKLANLEDANFTSTPRKQDLSLSTKVDLSAMQFTNGTYEDIFNAKFLQHNASLSKNADFSTDSKSIVLKCDFLKDITSKSLSEPDETLKGPVITNHSFEVITPTKLNSSSTDSFLFIENELASKTRQDDTFDVICGYTREVLDNAENEFTQEMYTNKVGYTDATPASIETGIRENVPAIFNSLNVRDSSSTVDGNTALFIDRTSTIVHSALGINHTKALCGATSVCSDNTIGTDVNAAPVCSNFMDNNDILEENNDAFVFDSTTLVAHNKTPVDMTTAAVNKNRDVADISSNVVGNKAAVIDRGAPDMVGCATMTEGFTVTMDTDITVMNTSCESVLDNSGELTDSCKSSDLTATFDVISLSDELLYRKHRKGIFGVPFIGKILHKILKPDPEK